MSLTVVALSVRYRQGPSPSWQFLRYHTQFSFENHWVLGNPKCRVLPLILCVHDISFESNFQVTKNFECARTSLGISGITLNTHLAHFHRKRDNTWNTQIYPNYPREDRVPNWKFQHSYPTQTRPILKIKTYPLRPGYRISQWHYQSRLNHSNCHLSNPKTQSALKLENMTKGQIYTVDAITGNCFMQQSNCEIQRIGVSVS